MVKDVITATKVGNVKVLTVKNVKSLDLLKMLGNFLIYICIPFVLTTLYFGTKGGYYDTDKYDGDGTAHKVLK